MPFITEVQCQCGKVREIWLKQSNDPPAPEDCLCPCCGSRKFSRVLGGTFGSYESSDRATKSEILKKRSLDHTKKTAQRNVDRIIETSRQRQR